MARSYSYSPSPSRGYRGRYRSPSPKGRYGGGRERDPPTSLLVRNLRRDTRTEDLRGPFGEFGPLKDVYLPRDYYTGDPRGFGFVQYVYSEDAVEAKYEMDGQVINGREITVVFAEENRKKPSEMRARDRVRVIRRSPPRHGRSYSRSPRYARTYSRSPDYYLPSPYSRSVSPRGRKYRERSYSSSPYGSRSRSRSPIPEQSRSPNRSDGEY
ncbi:RNA splicing factor [Lithospermum erythrorhizon]|uniref:RNA splicing factor n=1 Tax=Lithospermum erythrorhizon TaxID=34254 RepID=A0AAV3PUG0_LITER